jgi:hypothetical protein
LNSWIVSSAATKNASEKSHFFENPLNTFYVGT